MAPLPQGRYRLSSLRVRARKPQGGGRPRGVPDREQLEGRRSARHLQRRRSILRRVLQRSRRNAPRSHGLWAGEETGCEEGHDGERENSEQEDSEQEDSEQEDIEEESRHEARAVAPISTLMVRSP